MKKLIIATLLAAVQITFAGTKLAPDLPKTASLNLIEVIVQFKNLPTKDDLKQLGPFGQMKQLNIVNGVHLWLPMAIINILAKLPNIAYISPVRRVKGALDITTQAVNANLAWQYGWTGTGIGIAVIDSGIAARHDLTNSGGQRRRNLRSGANRRRNFEWR